MGKKVGTWIYYDKKGNQLSKIQHNQVVRQNNGFTLFVAFDQTAAGIDAEIFDGYIAKNSTIEAYIRKPSETEYSNMAYATSNGVREIKFEKVSDNEMTYGLVEGQGYLVYEMNFETFNEPTNEYGNINIDLKICKKVKIEGTDPEEHKDVVVSLGVVNIYVQPTYNSDDAKVTDIEIINERFKDTVKKIGGVSYNQTLTTQDGETIVIDGEVDTKKAKFSALTQEENEDLRPATVGFVEKHADEKIGDITKSTVKEEIDDAARTLHKNIENVASTLAHLYDTSEVVNSKIDSAILKADHVTEMAALTRDELGNNAKKVGFKYKTDTDDTNFKENVILDLDDRVALKSDIDNKVGELNTTINKKLDTYKVKTLENGNSDDTSETGYAKFHYNQKETIKAKMPKNILYFTESEEGNGEPAESEFVEKAKLDSLGQSIVKTYTKDLKIGLSNDVLTIESITGEDRAKGNAVNVSLTEYAKKTNIPTKLKQLVSDEENRTVTDLEKEEWNKKEIQLLSSINVLESFDDLPPTTLLVLGRILVTKTEGSLPLNIYKCTSNQGVIKWEKVDIVKTNCLYILKNTGLVYTFLETEPYFKQVSSEENIDLSNYATKNELQNYSLKTEVGNSVELDLKNGDLTIVLKDVDGKQLDSSTVSLDRDQVITGGEYVDGKIILSLQDGTTIEIPVEEMVSGLATTTQVEILSTNLNKEINSLKSGKANEADLKSVAKLGTFASLNEKPTTISGYGITDAYIDGDTVNAQVIRLGDKTITPITSVTYDIVGSKPKLNTSNTDSLIVNEEEIIGNEIKLHKVSKTGSYDDLNNKPPLFSKSYNDLTDKPTLFSEKYSDLIGKPTLNTTSSSSLAISNSEEISSQIKLHKISKTGSYNDLLDKPNNSIVDNVITINGTSLAVEDGQILDQVLTPTSTRGVTSKAICEGTSKVFVNDYYKREPHIVAPEVGPSGKTAEWGYDDIQVGKTISLPKKYFLMNGRETVTDFEYDDPTDNTGNAIYGNDSPIWVEANEVNELFVGSASTAGSDIKLISALNPDINTLIIICWYLKEEKIYQSIAVPEEFLYYTTVDAPLALRSTTAEKNKTLTLYKKNLNPTCLTINSNNSGEIEVKHVYRYSAMKLN